MSDPAIIVVQTTPTANITTTSNNVVANVVIGGPQGAAGVGVPSGGTAGQVLAKIDSTNYNTQWVNQTGGGGGSAITSINGYTTGAIVLNTDDISDTARTNKWMTPAEKTKLSNLSGTNTGDQTITLTGAVTGSGTGTFVTTIPANSITLAQQANMATGSLVYRKTAGTGAPEINTLATLKTDLGLSGTNTGDQTSIVGITGTKAQFNTAVTDGDILYVGDITTPNVFSTIAVSGQSSVVADSSADTLTLVAGTNVTITTDATTDTITINASGGGGGSSFPSPIALAFTSIGF